MTLITIRQTGALDASPNAEISFAGQAGFSVTVTDPFSPAEEETLGWYYEKWLAFPFTQTVRAQTAATSVRTYGQQLFDQLFRQQPSIYAAYRQAVDQGVQTLRFQVIGAPAFHHLHWEALWDPDRPRPFVLDAPLIRSTVHPTVHHFTAQPSPTLNLLLVTARPRGHRDVGYRTIARPLIEMLRQTQLPVQVDMVRPGSYKALVEHLQAVRARHGVGYYHLIHFDLHGAVLTYDQLASLGDPSAVAYQVRLTDRYARPDLTQPPAPSPPTAYLFFEDEAANTLDPASAQDVAQLLLDHQIPLTVLNACQSGQETGSSETSLGSQLLQAGVQTVLAMGYSVTVSAATLLMEHFYRTLFDQRDLATAIGRGRSALYNQKRRQVYFNQQIALEDWLLPVVYQPTATSPTTLPLRELTFDEQIAFFARQETRYPPPAPTYTFVGRDVDILQIQKRLLRTQEGKRRNLLLIRGLGGAGKSTLLHHLAWWWQTTGLVQEVFYFGYDEKAHTLQQILDAIARRLLNQHVPAGATVTREFATFQSMQPPVQARLLAQKLRSERHLLLLDNLESVTGDPLAIPHTLNEAERAAVRGFLADLLDGQTLVLLGSRGAAEWLSSGPNAPLRPVDLYDLPGLDAEAASLLADYVLERQVADETQRQTYRQSPAFRQLLKLLDGHPLALEVVLSNLARQTPDAILAALQAADTSLDAKAQDATLSENERRTQTILGCIAYAHSNLDTDAQKLLLCLFPFTGVVWKDQLANYTKHLQAQPALAPLPFDRWDAVLGAAQAWGLLTAHEVSGFLRLQPVLPYFLKIRLAGEPDEFCKSVETAFRSHYNDLGEVLGGLLKSKEPQQQQIGRIIINIEYENLSSALQLALVSHTEFYNTYEALFRYMRVEQAHHQALHLSEKVWLAHSNYDVEQMTGKLGEYFSLVLNRLAVQQLELRQYDAARLSYEQELSLVRKFVHYSKEERGKSEAQSYHQLGIVAQEQRQWAQAEQHYQQALALKIEYNDRYSQARTYHGLGMVAQEQRQWAQAEQHYQQALALFIEYNDRYSQASTFNNLGSLAEDQELWPEAYEYYAKALAIAVESKDEYRIGTRLESLRRLWQAHPDEAALAAVAAALGVSVDAAQARLTTAD